MAALTSQLAIGYQNLASGKTVTSTTAATGYPASNLSDPRLQTTLWRSTTGSLTSQNVDVDLSSSQSYDVVGLLGTNLEDSATRTPLGDDVNNFATPDWAPGSASVFDTSVPPLLSGRDGWLVFGRHLIIFTLTTQTDRYVRVTLNNSGNADNYLRAAVYWVGPIIQLSFDALWEPAPWRFSGVPGSDRIQRLHTFTFRALTFQQKVYLESLLYKLKRSGRLLLVPRPDKKETYQNEAIYCTFAENDPIRWVRMLAMSGQSGDLWQCVVNFIEVID